MLPESGPRVLGSDNGGASQEHRAGWAIDTFEYEYRVEVVHRLLVPVETFHDLKKKHPALRNMPPGRDARPPRKLAVAVFYLGHIQGSGEK